MRIAHCQLETWCGDFDHNLRRVEEGLPARRRSARRSFRFLNASSPAIPTPGKWRAATRGPEMSFGLSKSAWSFREFGKLLETAAKV